MATIGYDFERTVAAAPNTLRKALVGTLRDLGCQVTVEQLTLVEARRGSRFASLMATVPKRLPLQLTFTLQSVETGTRLAGHFTDGWGKGAALGATVGANWAFEQAFREILARLDETIVRLDPSAPAPYDPSGFWSSLGTIGPMEKLRGFGGRMGGAAIDRVSGTIEGDHDPTPEAWRRVERVALALDGREASLTLPEIQAHLAVSMLLDAQPGSMPPNLVRDVERLVIRVEEALNGATGDIVLIEVTAAEKPVLEFLHQQVRIRDGLPVRTLHVCMTCRLEKITNPDYARIAARNNRLRSLVGVGATITGGSIQPFVMVGSLLKLAKLDPDYVCSRCQGMDATEGIVTFCPSCGELRKEAVLRICPRCKHDFRGALGPEEFWGAPRPVPVPAGAPVAAVPTWAAPVAASGPPTAPVPPGLASPAADVAVAPLVPADPVAAPVAPPTEQASTVAQVPSPAELVAPAPVPAPPPPLVPAEPIAAFAPPVAQPPAAAEVPAEPIAAFAPPVAQPPAAAEVPAPVVAPPVTQPPVTQPPVTKPPLPPMARPAIPPTGPAPALPVTPIQPPAPLPGPYASYAAPAPPPAAPQTPSWPPPPKKSGPSSASWPPPSKAGGQPGSSWPAPTSAARPGSPLAAAPAAAPTRASPSPHEARTFRLGPGGGKLCESCGREFAALWRIVVPTPTGTADRFVCGLPPACSVPSLVAPVRV